MVVVGVLPMVIAVAAVLGIAKLVAGVGHVVPASPAVWVPLFVLGAGLTFWGLWLGFTIHRRDGPLKLGLFGLLTTAFGFLVYPPLIVVGALIVLAAAMASAAAGASARVGSKAGET